MESIKEQILSEEKRAYLLIPHDKYNQLLGELTQEELSEITSGSFANMKVILDSSVNAIRLTNVLPPSIAAKKVFRWINVAALSFTEKRRFRDHVKSVQEQYATQIFSGFYHNGMIELVFDTEQKADSFIETFLYFANLAKPVVAHLDGKTVYVRHRTKLDKKYRIGGRIV